MRLDHRQVNAPKNQNEDEYIIVQNNENVEKTETNIFTIKSITSNLVFDFSDSESSFSDAIVLSLARSLRIFVLSQSLLATTIAI